MFKQSAISRSTKNTVRAIAGAVALFGALEFAQASPVVDPGHTVAGISQLDLSQQWWQWVVSIPTSGNPQYDIDGSLAQTNNNGPVFFVAGNFGAPPYNPSERTFTVPAGKPLFFPVLNSADFEFRDVRPNCIDDPTYLDPAHTSLECALSFISPALEPDMVTIHATLDGQLELLTFFPSHRQTSTSFFDIDLPIGNVFGKDAGNYPGIAVSDGYWIALDGLSPGRHTLVFGGTDGNGFTLEVTDTLNVPEPGTLGLLFLGSLAALGYRRFGIGPKRI